MNTDKSEKERFIFPENNAFLITEIMKKYGLEEKEGDSLEKILRGEKTKGEITAKIIKRRGEKEISEKNLTTEIKKNLGLSNEKAMAMAEEIEAKFFSPTKAHVLVIEPKTKKEVWKKIEVRPPSRSSGDTYQEPI